MEQRKAGRLNRRDFLYITGLVTITLGTQASLSLVAVRAQANSETEKLVPASFWDQLEVFMADEVLPKSGLYSHLGYGLDGALTLQHPLGCPCCS